MDGRIIDTTGRSIPVTVKTAKNFLVQAAEARKTMRETLQRLRTRGATVAPTGEIILEVDSENQETR